MPREKVIVPATYYVRPDQLRALYHLAHQLGKKQSELVREAIDLLLRHYNLEPPTEGKEGLAPSAPACEIEKA